MLPASVLVKDETDIRARPYEAPMALSVPTAPRLMTSMPSTRAAAHGDIPPEHLVARATAERKSVRGLRLGRIAGIRFTLTGVL
jgi:hypothetical protein